NTTGTGLVYVKSRRKTVEMSKYLNRMGIQSDFYHAGLNSTERSKKQEEWKSGQSRIMVCTNAFGMCIDKPDVRFVLHEQKPDTTEAYYQEAGRAGRDENYSACTLFYHPADFEEDIPNEERQFPKTKDIIRVYELLCNYLNL